MPSGYEVQFATINDEVLSPAQGKEQEVLLPLKKYPNPNTQFKVSLYLKKALTQSTSEFKLELPYPKTDVVQFVSSFTTNHAGIKFQGTSLAFSSGSGPQPTSVRYPRKRTVKSLKIDFPKGKHQWHAKRNGIPSNLSLQWKVQSVEEKPKDNPGAALPIYTFMLLLIFGSLYSVSIKTGRFKKPLMILFGLITGMVFFTTLGPNTILYHLISLFFHIYPFNFLGLQISPTFYFFYLIMSLYWLYQVNTDPTCTEED